MEKWPEVEFPDDANACCLAPVDTSRKNSRLTKAWMPTNTLSLDGSETSSWEKQVCILIGKGNHSQRMNDTPLKPWVAAQMNIELSLQPTATAWPVWARFAQALYSVYNGI